MAKGEDIHFEVRAGNDAILKEFTSSKHPGVALTDSAIDLKANEDFNIDITFRAAATATWKNYRKPSATCGYASGSIKRYINNSLITYTFVDGVEDQGRQIQKGKDCVFTIIGLNPMKHKVICWKVKKRRNRRKNNSE